MHKRITVIVISLIGAISMIVSTSCNSTSSSAPSLTTGSVPSPTIVTSTDTPAPTSTPTSTPTEMAKEIPAPLACPWVAYFYDGESVTSPNDGGCLDGEKGIHVSEDLKIISFFVSRSSSIGTYGVCRDVSETDNLKFGVAIHNKIVSSRFLIMVSPAPIPTKKSSFGFRFQPEIMINKEKGLYVKQIEYVSDDYDSDKGGIQAAIDWKLKDYWNFDFIVQLSGSQGYLSVNKKALSRTWPLKYSDRYLCFAYQLMPSVSNASELEVNVSFP